MTIHSLVVLLSQFWTSSLFLVRFQLLLLDLHAYKFLRRLVSWSGIPISLRILQFAVIHIVKGFLIVNEAEVHIFLELPSFLHDPTNVCNLISGSSAFSKSSLYTWKFSVYVLLKPSLEDFEHYLASMWNEHNCIVVWMFFGIALLWDWKENWPFLVLQPLLSFHIYWHIECSTFTASSFRIWNSSTGISSPPLALFIVMLPKAHLTSHSRMSGSKWVITPLWLSGSWRSFFIVLLCILASSS